MKYLQNRALGVNSNCDIMKLFFLFVFLFVVQLGFALKPDSVYHVRPESYALIYKEFDVETKDGYNIKTWFFPAQVVINKDSFEYYRKYPQCKPYEIICEEPAPTIVICDGDAVNMCGSLAFVLGIVSKGYNVVTFDWRGFGGSSKFPINEDWLCHTEFLIDYNAVVDSIAQLKEVDCQNIAVYGGSTGAYLSFAVAYMNKNIKCFAGRGIMTTFDDFLKNRSIRKFGGDRCVKKPVDYPMNLYPINIAPHFKKPVFLLVGENDIRTPLTMSYAIFEKLMVDKILWVVAGASHGGHSGPEFIDYNRFMNNLIAFFDNNLKCK